MDQTAFNTAKSAYQKGDWTLAAAALNVAKEPGEISGTIDHLLGNSLMKLGRFRDAADAYGRALEDRAYGKAGALNCNRGRALLAAGDAQGAIAALTAALTDPEYATPYKAQLALGNAQLQAGNVREAGISFRNAAIDEGNPDPSTALAKLGQCFIQLGRPIDAIEALRTALDFSGPTDSQAPVYAQLGSAYVAANRMPEAIDAFVHAGEDPAYSFSPEEQASYDAARKAVAAVAGVDPSDTDGLLAAGAGAGSSSFDPLDPLGRSGEIMPSPEDTGFFEISEEELRAQDKARRKMRRKNNHSVLKFFLTLLILALLAAGAAAFAYWKGYGWPTQQMSVESLFKAASSGADISDFTVEGLSDGSKQTISDIIPLGSEVKVEGVDQDMTSSTVRAVATLPGGGEQTYTIQLRRSGIGWKVASVELVYPASEDTGTQLSGTTETGSVEVAETAENSEAAPAEGQPAEAAPAEGQPAEAENTETAENQG